MPFFTRQGAAIAAALALSASPALASSRTRSASSVKARTALVAKIASVTHSGIELSYRASKGGRSTFDPLLSEAGVSAGTAADDVNRVPVDPAQLPTKLEWVLGAKIQISKGRRLDTGSHDLVHHHAATGRRLIAQGIADHRLSNYSVGQPNTLLGVLHPRLSAAPYPGARELAAAASARLRWTGRQRTDIVGNIGLGSMVCTSSSSCEALDADGRLVQFHSDPDQSAPNDIADANQAVLTGIDPTAPLIALACPDADQCTAVDRTGSVTTFYGPYQGFRFTQVDHAVSEPSAMTVTGLACASTSRCVVVDGAGGVVSFSPTDPSAATRTVLVPGSPLIAVVCPSATQCTAIGATREWTFDPGNPAGATTATIDTAPTAVTALVCSSTRQCTSVDGSGRETTFDPQTTAGGTPVAVSRAAGADLSAVICPMSSLCTAADQTGYLKSFDPVSGALISSVPATDVDDLVCMTGTYCLADQRNGDVLPFDAGSSQDLLTQATSLDSGSPIVALSCPAADQCLAVDPTHQTRFDPQPNQHPDFGGIYGFPGGAHDPITGLACPQLTSCTVVRGEEQITFNIDHSQRLHPRIIDDTAGATLTAVRCPTAEECVAIDSDGAAITYNPASGHIVRGRIAVQKSRALNGLSCPSRAQCTATDDDGHAISFDPLTGHRLLDLAIDTRVGLDSPGDPSGHELDAITCHSTQACAAVDTFGDVVTFNPHSRAGMRLHRYDKQSGLTAISCPTGGFCMAAGSDGHVYYGRPSALRWTSTPLLAASALTAVTCESATVCIAADDAGDTYTSHAK